MKSVFILAGIFFIASFAGIINARKDPGEYKQGVKKDDVAMPEFVQSGLVDVSKVTSKEVDNCHDTSSFGSRDFEPRPNISAYNDNSKEDTLFGKDFEPRPNISAYNNDEEKQSFVKDFEPRPSVTAYNEDEENQSET